ncbi:hypothetical protein [Synechococcus sp. RS9907]|uniref:hypothetical protein n=1 Tax=Synechococcus sp. RS9907 TaxID=221350 RepID=UPI00165D3ADB|nr:hypothetical protein [Synechococcus sp. RS9907]
MARLEAWMDGVVDSPDRRQALSQLTGRLGGQLEWLDPRNAEVKLACGDQALLVTAWIELLPSNRLRLLLSSPEGMSTGAQVTSTALEAILQGLLDIAEGSTVRFRSDRDGPLLKPQGIAIPADPLID